MGDETAEDCVAETFSRVLEALRRGKGPRDYLQAYLYRVARWVTDFYHRSPPPAEELPETQPAPNPLPESETLQREGQARLRAALAQLTPNQRQVIALKYLKELENSVTEAGANSSLNPLSSPQYAFNLFLSSSR